MVGDSSPRNGESFSREPPRIVKATANPFSNTRIRKRGGKDRLTECNCKMAALEDRGLGSGGDLQGCVPLRFQAICDQ